MEPKHLERLVFLMYSFNHAFVLLRLIFLFSFSDSAWRGFHEFQILEIVLS